MRQFIAAIASVIALSFASVLPAFAADMPTKMPLKAAAMAAATPWTGFYINGGIGYGMWAADETSNVPTGAIVMGETQVQAGKGWLATIGAGYDYQFTPKIVAGLFGEASVSSLKGTITERGQAQQGDISQTSSWAFGGRVGWLVTPQSMSYVNGGYIAARFSAVNLFPVLIVGPVGVSTPSFTANGWFLGGGVETSLAPNWFWRNEYRYASYGSKALVETAPGLLNINFKPTVQTVTSQIVYKFNGGLPAPAYPATSTVATNWTGFYANVGAGYGLWNADSNETPVGGPCLLCATRIQGGKGYLARVGAGYDWQFAPVWVAGIFGDFDISSLKGTLSDQNQAVSGTIKQTSAWAAGARLGWLPSPQTMTYVDGGFTGSRFSDTNMVLMTISTPIGFAAPATTFNGWFAGGGVETTFDFFGMFSKGWFWRNEYRYASYGQKTITDTFGGFSITNINFKPVVQTVTSSVIFKFN